MESTKCFQLLGRSVDKQTGAKFTKQFFKYDRELISTKVTQLKQPVIFYRKSISRNSTHPQY